MGIIEEIKRMQLEGRQEGDIMQNLQAKGYSPQDISEAVGQSKIKNAVEGDDSQHHEEFQPQMPEEQTSFGGMQPSMMNTPESAPEPVHTQPQYSPEPYNEAPSAQEYGNQNAVQYQDYNNQYASGTSADTITEIAEQIVSEKMYSVKNDLEKVMDMKNTFDAKISFIDERLKRIEKVIDRLQLSVLQKVGEHMTNIEDMKKELQETQQSFKALVTNKTATT